MKKIVIGILCVGILFLATACSGKKVSTEKLRDVDFTVVTEDKIPKELKGMMEEKKGLPFKLTYSDKGELYIAVGYGEQPTTGYSIEVKDLYETKNAIYIHTNLIGPAKDERVLQRKTHPYIVVKLEAIDKNVVFK